MPVIASCEFITSVIFIANVIVIVIAIVNVIASAIVNISNAIITLFALGNVKLLLAIPIC